MAPEELDSGTNKSKLQSTGHSRSTASLEIFDHDLPGDIVDFCSAKDIAVDTETDGLLFRRDKLRLVQTECAGHVFIVRNPDSRSLNLEDLFRYVRSATFHHAAFDLKFLAWWCGIFPNTTIQCTKTLSKLLGDEFSGLGSCLKRYIDVRLENKTRDMAKSDWSLSDLTDAQKTYACGDVLYLRELHDVMFKEYEKQYPEGMVSYNNLMNIIQSNVKLDIQGLLDTLTYEGKPQMDLRRTWLEQSKKNTIERVLARAEMMKKNVNS